MQITADIYPYTYWQSNLGVLYPKRNFSDETETKFVLEHVALADDIIFNSFRAHPEYVGKTLAQVADVRQASPARTLMALLAEPGGEDTGIVAKGMADADVERLFRGRYRQRLQRRNVDRTASTRLRQFRQGSRPVRARPKALHARRGGAQDVEPRARPTSACGTAGGVEPGYFADLVLFDPAIVADRADFGKAQAQAIGIRTRVGERPGRLQDGKTTPARPGRALRRER